MATSPYTRVRTPARRDLRWTAGRRFLMSAPRISDDGESAGDPIFSTLRDVEPIRGRGPAPHDAISLYRKYRPQSFDADELVGQDHVIRTLRNALSLGRVAHAYL